MVTITSASAKAGGAVGIVAERPVEASCPVIQVRDSHALTATNCRVGEKALGRKDRGGDGKRGEDHDEGCDCGYAGDGNADGEE